MRIRTTTAAAVSGAVVLSALAVPAAQAFDSQKGNTKITKVVVNGGKDLVVGTSKKKFVITVTGTDPKGIKEGIALVWHGKAYPERADGAIAPQVEPECVKLSATKGTCKVVVVADPRGLRNGTAGQWKVLAGLLGKGSAENHVVKGKYTTVGVKRAAKLTVNATPEPVRKGKTLTVSGALTRADWEKRTYAGYTGQPVKLQFKAKGASAYKTLKTVKSDAKGNLRTTVKASVDGSFRYVFGGAGTSPAVTAAGDFVDVR